MTATFRGHSIRRMFNPWTDNYYYVTNCKQFNSLAEAQEHIRDITRQIVIGGE